MADGWGRRGDESARACLGHALTLVRAHRISLAAGSTHLSARLSRCFATDVTSHELRLEFRILGQLEARVETGPLALGGGKPRSLLATLLLRAGDIVPAELLVDELWGTSPPPSALHTLEVYISRLRRVLNGHGPALVRRGVGYVLELDGATLDARVFSEALAGVTAAAAGGAHDVVARQGREALALWRGPVLADVELGPLARADAERLEESRLHALELCIDAELALGRHDQLVGELQALGAQHPYRERFVAQLMLALYRSGRHAEALDAYETVRRRLDADLGLQPSADLQQLSARIVRQEPELRARTSTWPQQADRVPGRHQLRARRLSALVAAGAAAAAVVALSAAGGAPDGATAASTTRVALVLQAESPVTAYTPTRHRWLTDGLHGIAEGGVETQLIDVADVVTGADVERVAGQLRDVDLALFAVDGPSAAAFVPAVLGLERTKFVFIDTSMRELGLERSSNVTAIRFASEQPSLLAGALSGLMSPNGAARGERPDLVSVVAGRPTAETKRVLTAFRRGVSRALPNGAVRIGYTNETDDPTACELLANRQIDAGADVVFVHAGQCGAGALAVARTRRVWAIASDGLGRAVDNIIGAAFKDWGSAVSEAVAAFREHRLPAGRDITLTLDGYHVGLELHASVPSRVASKVVELCSDVRLQAMRSEPTTDS